MTDEENIDNIFNAMIIDGEPKKMEIPDSIASKQSNPFGQDEKGDAKAILPISQGKDAELAQPGK